jgi:hypothetical protein
VNFWAFRHESGTKAAHSETEHPLRSLPARMPPDPASTEIIGLSALIWTALSAAIAFGLRRRRQSIEAADFAAGVVGTWAGVAPTCSPYPRTYTESQMARRTVWAMALMAVAVIAPLFVIGAILDWPDEAFAWIVLGGGPIGTVIAYLLFYEEPRPSEAKELGTPPGPALAELIARIDALEQRLREDLEERRGERRERTAPRPSGS